ncbi:hypothetical protein DAEQUDRAFT_693764 [Daedalea quercina L-15889]|uniref:Uncharacterized protein n=1 Tax=Daedalea quercina L-15889 TaxID=1314783 RepID=A0A165P0I8_9APHY|nr:hypothetical protein DAEQUDRAFT_693764 [Daedalea quercina L-15889]
MARATRSAGQPDKDIAQDTAPAPRKGGSKKRKRTSNADGGEQPATKQQRTSESQEPQDIIPSEQPEGDKPPDTLTSGDVPTDPADAEKILLVLESIDTQGLLDRVFPLPTESAEPTPGESASTPTPSSSTQTFSFRTLLKDSSQYPLRVLRSAIQHLFPISSHPRSRPSEPAAQQLRFCNLALALLDQASFHSVPTPLEAQSIFPTLFQPPSIDGEVAEEAKPAPTTPATRKRKYALVQHLPTGDWWTSLNSDFMPPSEGKALTDLPTGHAELAAILPSASSSSTTRETTLAEYVRPRPASATLQMPGSRRVSCGKFLDYGPYASFAPTFDQDGTEVGRHALGEVIWRQRHEASRGAKARGKRKAIEASQAAEDDEVVLVSEDTRRNIRTSDQEKENDGEELDEALQSLLPSDDIARIKAALGSLELEQAVQELLDKNARALLRLQRLQRLRLGGEGGGSSAVEEGSEEWDTAQAILDSLTVLTSLRPRSSDDPIPPLVPPIQVLRTLQRSLPLEGTEGWYGTLPPGRLTALRDDTTVHVKPGTEAAAAPATTTTSAVPVTPAKPVAAPSAYTPYGYNYQASQYRGTYQYTPGQGGSYYPSATGTTTNSYYPNSQYSAQGQYSYPSYYPYQQTTQAQVQSTTSGGATSGRATPQPAASPTTMPTNYASFFASSAQTQQPQRAVANTVTGTGAKPYQAGTWTGTQGTSGYIAPLPAHLRSAAAASASQPTTPGATAPYSYYGNYQSTTPAAR